MDDPKILDFNNLTSESFTKLDEYKTKLTNFITSLNLDYNNDPMNYTSDDEDEDDLDLGTNQPERAVPDDKVAYDKRYSAVYDILQQHKNKVDEILKSVNDNITTLQKKYTSTSLEKMCRLHHNNKNVGHFNAQNKEVLFQQPGPTGGKSHRKHRNKKRRTNKRRRRDF